jgi:hypothetical protein
MNQHLPRFPVRVFRVVRGFNPCLFQVKPISIFYFPNSSFCFRNTYELFRQVLRSVLLVLLEPAVLQSFETNGKKDRNVCNVTTAHLFFSRSVT